MLNTPVFILLGPPGSGKSTQGARLAAELLIPRLSTGDLLRAEVAARTDSGIQAQAVMEAGGVVEDRLVNEMLRCRLLTGDCARGFILDGYPRTVPQATYLQDLLSQLGLGEPVIIEFVVELNELLKRLTTREYCPNCGRLYNALWPPLRQGFCDADGSALARRADDDRRSIAQRLADHERLSHILQQHFEGRRMHRIAAHDAPSEIFRRVMQIAREERQVNHKAAPSTAA